MEKCVWTRKYGYKNILLYNIIGYDIDIVCQSASDAVESIGGSLGVGWHSCSERRSVKVPHPPPRWGPCQDLLCGQCLQSSTGSQRWIPLGGAGGGWYDGRHNKLQVGRRAVVRQSCNGHGIAPDVIINHKTESPPPPHALWLFHNVSILSIRANWEDLRLSSSVVRDWAPY